MGVNAYTTNLNVRERQSTYVPMPFEEMYAVLQDKQKRYDTADAIEREAKRSVSALSTPIKGHSEYLEKKKQDYLTQAMQLHSSMPDKGSADYKRKLDGIIDSFSSDPNITLINSSAQEWVKGRETAAKLMADGKYSTYQDRYNLSFNGVDATTGALQRYNFLGIKPKVDYTKILEEAAKNTPEQSQDITVAKADGTVTRRKISIKSKDAILGSVSTALSMNPDAIGEMTSELGLDSKGVKKYLDVFSAYQQKRETVSEDRFDSGTAKYFDEKKKEQMQADALAVPLSTVPNTNFRKTQEQLKSYIDEKGNFKPSVAQFAEPGKRVSYVTQGGEIHYQDGSTNAGSGTIAGTKEQKVTNSISQVERLIRETHKDVYENFLQARKNYPNAKELALKDAIAYIQEQKEGTPLYGTTIDDDDQRANIKNAFFGNPNSVMLYSLDEKDKGEVKPLSTLLGEFKEADMRIGGKLTASPYGRDKTTGMPLQSYSINLGNKAYVATFGTLNPRDEQAQALYDVEHLGKKAIIHNFEPDPLNYPELGNKRVAKMEVYLNRVGNGQYNVCGNDISGQ